MFDSTLLGPNKKYLKSKICFENHTSMLIHTKTIKCTTNINLPNYDKEVFLFKITQKEKKSSSYFQEISI